MRKVFIFCIVLFFQTNTFAIELQEALDKAYENSDDLKQGRNNFLLDLEVFPKALSSFLPTVEAGISSSTTKQKLLSQYIPDAQSTRSENLQRNIQLRQSLFDGGASTANLKAAQSALRSARAKFYSQEQKVLYNIIQAYMNYYSSKEKYNISEVTVKSYEKQLESTQEKLKLGEATETEVASARSALAMSESDRLSTYSSYQSAEAEFSRIFGFVPTDELQLPKLPDDLPKSFEELQKKALAANYELNQSINDLSAAKSSEVSAKSGLLPNVDLTFSANRTYYSPESVNSSQVNNSGITSTLSVQVPIFSRGLEYSKIREAKNRTRSGVIQIENQKKQLNSQCTSVWSGLNTSNSKILATKRAVEASEMAYNGMLQEESVGTKTTVDVLEAKDKLYRAKIQNVEANTENILIAYQMKAITGELTAKKLKLKVKYFDPDSEIRKSKAMIIGGASERTRKK